MQNCTWDYIQNKTSIFIEFQAITKLAGLKIYEISVRVPLNCHANANCHLKVIFPILIAACIFNKGFWNSYFSSSRSKSSIKEFGSAFSKTALRAISPTSVLYSTSREWRTSRMLPANVLIHDCNSLLLQTSATDSERQNLINRHFFSVCTELFIIESWQTYRCTLFRVLLCETSSLFSKFVTFWHICERRELLVCLC